MQGLTYKFNNYDKNIIIERKDFFNPKKCVFYVKDGDYIYVENGKEVKVGQLLVKKSNGIKYYSSISGIANIQGNSVVITNDNNDTEDKVEGLLNIDNITKEDIINTCEKFGINNGVNLLLDEFKSNKKVLIVNTIDIEPYTFNNRYLFQDNCKNTLELLEKISKLFNISTYLFMYINDPNIVSIQSLINNYPSVKLNKIKDKYPYNNNLFILKKYLKEYGDNEVIKLDLLTLHKLFVGLIDKKPLNERYITVIFNNPLRYFVVNTYYGVYLEEMIDSFVPPSWGGKSVYLNNFFRKNKCTNFDHLSLNDTVNTIFVLDDVNEVVTKCIKCGKCADICPIKINPLDKKLDPSCIRCGLCNYICPANINLIVRVKDNG